VLLWLETLRCDVFVGGRLGRLRLEETRRSTQEILKLLILCGHSTGHPWPLCRHSFAPSSVKRRLCLRGRLTLISHQAQAANAADCLLVRVRACFLRLGCERTLGAMSSIRPCSNDLSRSLRNRSGCKFTRYWKSSNKRPSLCMKAPLEPNKADQVRGGHHVQTLFGQDLCRSSAA
jgi:hypothetical protein